MIFIYSPVIKWIRFIRFNFWFFPKRILPMNVFQFVEEYFKMV
jgi:hypothetical protein